MTISNRHPADARSARAKDDGAPVVAIVVPCYNEQEVLTESGSRLLALVGDLVKAGSVSSESKIYFVDDGSRDHTWALIQQFAAQDVRIVGIKLSRNRGHQNALLAGLFTAKGEAVISIDADLQDDIGAIREMVGRFRAGADIVYGVRRGRDSDSRFKRGTARFFYELMRLLGAESISDHADYRLLSRLAVESLKQYREVNLYLRGMVPLLGYRSEIVYYDRAKRFAGESKYPTRKMIALALEAITSFSVVPLRVIAIMGFCIFGASMLVTLWALWVRIFTNDSVPGWASVVLPMYLLGGVQIFCLGTIGEYVGKVYSEVKARPRFLIERITSSESEIPEAPVRTRSDAFT